MSGRYKAYPEYKSTDEVWLGEIPSHWRDLKINRLTIVKRGASPRPIDDPKYFDEAGEYAWVRIADVTASGTYLENTTQRLSPLGASLSVKLEPNQLFLSIAGTVGKPCINKIKACIHDGFVYFPEYRENTKFLFYIFAAGEAYKGLGKFGTQLNLNTETVGGIKIGIPCMEEQQKIANFLDHETDKIDALIAKQEKLIELLKEKRQAVISHSVTKGLNPNIPMKDSGVEWLGEVPEHWGVSQIKYKVKPGTSITYGIVQAGPHIEDGIPYIKTSDMVSSSLPTSGYSKTSYQIDESYKRSKVFYGDVVVAIRASVGKCLPVPKELDGANLTQGTAKISPGKDLRTNYLVNYFASSQLQTHLNSISKGATFKEITLEMLRAVYVLLPPLKEQTFISDYLEHQTDVFDRLITSSAKQMDLLKERKTALISAAVTGKIDVRDWEAE